MGRILNRNASSSALARNHGPLTPLAMTPSCSRGYWRPLPAQWALPACSSPCWWVGVHSDSERLRGPGARPGEALGGPLLSRSCDAASARAWRAGAAHARVAHSARGPSRGACVGTTVAAPVAFRVLRVRGCRAGRIEPGPSVSAGTTALTGTGPRRTGA